VGRRMTNCILCGAETPEPATEITPQYVVCSDCSRVWWRYYLRQWKERLLGWVRRQ
jgi:hypothetical protein